MGIRDELHHAIQRADYNAGYRYRDADGEYKQRDGHPTDGIDQSNVDRAMQGTRGLYEQHKAGK